MQTIHTQEHSYIAPRNVKQLKMTAADVADVFPDLKLLGIDLPEHKVRQMMSAMQGAGQSMGMDSLTSTLTAGSIGTPIQFLQNWLAGFVQIITQARKADDLLGMMVAGSWEDVQVVQGVQELTGLAIPYGDLTAVPFSAWNTNFVYRTVVRFEEGMQVGVLDEAQASRMRVNSAESKREAAALALEIARNLTAFYGYNSGTGLTYGMLNEPSLGAYVAAPNGTWASATFLQIQQDILTAIQGLRTQSGDQIDPETTMMTLGVATDVRDFLSTTSDFGISVMEWMNKAYPNIRVVSAPQFNLANAGANVFYLYADSVQDSSTDGGRTWLQVVPAKFRINGVEQKAKGYLEDYSNATAGAMCKRPFAVYRCTGI